MIHIKELFRLQDIQHLRLIAGRDGLERTVTAAVLFEYDPSRVQLPDFYRGDLVVTTLAYARGDAQLVAHSLQALMNQGIHGVDLLLYLAGPVKRVYARAKTLARKIEVEDTLSAVVDFASGAIGVIQATTSVYPGYPRRLEINGERGSIALEENSIAKWDIYSGSHEDIVVQPAAFSSASTPTAISLDGHTRQLADMIRAVKTGARPAIDVYEGRKPVDLILAIYRSAEEGRPIDL